MDSNDSFSVVVEPGEMGGYPPPLGPGPHPPPHPLHFQEHFDPGYPHRPYHGKYLILT